MLVLCQMELDGKHMPVGWCMCMGLSELLMIKFTMLMLALAIKVDAYPYKGVTQYLVVCILVYDYWNIQS